MTDRPTSLREAAVRTLAHARRSDLAFTAAGIAYYAQVSLLPAFVLGFVVLSTVAGDRLAVRVVEAAGDALSPTGRDLVREGLTDAAGRTEVSLAGVAVLLWGSLRLFRGLETAVSVVYASDDSDGVVVRWRDSAVTAVAVAAAVALVLGAGVLFDRSGLSVPNPLRAVVVTAAVAVVLVPLYAVLPKGDLGVLEVVPGAVVTAGGWVLLRTVFRLYLGLVGGSTVYGVLGGLVLLVTWLYLASLLLVAGAVVNAVLAGRDRHRKAT